MLLVERELRLPQKRKRGGRYQVPEHVVSDLGIHWIARMIAWRVSGHELLELALVLAGGSF